MPIKEISVEEASRLLEEGKEYIYLDVRSEFEFTQGHPQGAFNVPLKNMNMEMRMLEDNPDFLDVVEGNFDKNANLLIGCASGNRSRFAGMLLEQAGYQNVANVTEGFSGIRNMHGSIEHEGWLQRGYPVGKGDGEERGYPHLQKKGEAE